MTASADKPDELAAVLQRLSGAPSDQSAWRSLFRQIWPLVIAVAYRRLQNKGAAEDVAQEVFLRLMQAQPYTLIQEPSEFRAYVWRMTLNATNSAWRAEQRATRGKEPADEPAPSDYLAEPTMPADDYVALKQVLHRAEGLLAPQDIELLRLLLEGRHLSAAAKELQISYSNAAVRLHRAKKMIRNLLISKE